MSHCPRVFISSSTESKPVAKAVVEELKRLQIKTLPWWKAFRPGRYRAKTLTKLPDKVDAAVFVFGEDDEIHSRKAKTKRPRDNVVMEYGIFASRLEPKRCLICLMNNAVAPTNVDGVDGVALRSAEDVKTSKRFHRWAKTLKPLEDRLLKAFWSKAAQGDVLIVYPNQQQEFAKNVRLPGIVTGSGEAAATHRLGQTLERFGIRGEVFGTDSSKGLLYRREGLVILLGSRYSNELVARISRTSDWRPRFRFLKIEMDPSKKFHRLGIKDTAKADAPWKFDGNLKKGTDHALITFVASADGKKRILALGGLSTLGTQAAADFVCDGRAIEQLFRRIGETVDRDWSARAFELVLKAPISNSALDIGREIVQCNPSK